MFSARFHRRIVITDPSRLLAAAMLAGAALLSSGCGKTSGSNPAEAAAPQAFPVQVAVTPSVRIPDATEYLSILKSRRSANINPQVEGQITKIFVKSGDHVAPGTPLMQIDPLKQEATLGSQSEEHLVVDGVDPTAFHPGSHLLAIPMHVCPTVALHQKAYVIRDGDLVDEWEVSARNRQLTI